MCPLCDSSDSQPIEHHTKERYFHCRQCDLIFAHSSHWPNHETEKARYLEHNNEIGDPAYENFLSRLQLPMLSFIPSSGKGLDFGCGSSPALARMFHQKGYSTESYDPFFFNHPELLNQHYDFISASEVAEHLQNPRRVFTKLRSLLKPQGILGVMTSWHPGPKDFFDWYYARDPTHIAFYSATTFQWIAQWLKLFLAYQEKNVVILKRN